MTDKKNEEKNWWERNKGKVLIAGGAILALLAAVFIYHNKGAIKKAIVSLKGAIVSLFKSVKSKDIHIINQPPAMPPIKPDNNPFKVETLEPIHIVVSNPINGGKPYEVIGHIRNLPEGCHPSPEKIAEAAELGITLSKNQTWVTDYVKNTA